MYWLDYKVDKGLNSYNTTNPTQADNKSNKRKGKKYRIKDTKYMWMILMGKLWTNSRRKINNTIIIQ